MYMADTTVLSKENYREAYAALEKNLCLSKNLYNAALFRIRQVFTGWDKEARTDNEEEVFAELRVMQKAYPHVKVRRVFSYRALDALMRANQNPDFFAGLPMQTAQRVLKEAVTVFKAWLKSLGEYRRAPARYTGKPRMPRYLKGDLHTFYITNQDAVLYPVHRDVMDKSICEGKEIGGSCNGVELKLPHIKERVRLRHIAPESVLKEVQVKPYYGKLMLVLVLEKAEISVDSERPHAAGIDFGVDNIAAIVSTDHASCIYKGGAILSEMRTFNRKKAEAVGAITKGKKHMAADSARLRRLSLHHDGFTKDIMHKISTDIVRYCVRHRVGTIVMGVNPLWKQGTDMGKANNRKFTGLPHERLQKMILYKAEREGIRVICQEESYTSKADITAMDPMPVYGREEGKPVFSGRRTGRGLYVCSKGYRVNADCNGAANILRKAIPDAWGGSEDFRFLGHPESKDFKKLQRVRTA